MNIKKKDLHKYKSIIILCKVSASLSYTAILGK